MKITCILTSFNRPNFVRQALESVSKQSHKNYELLICDDSTIMDIRRIAERYSFTAARIFRFKVDSKQRSSQNRLGISINYALRQAAGDLVCYLADDDYYWPDWFSRAAEFFQVHPEALTGYGSLSYSRSRNMDYSQCDSVRFPGKILKNPAFEVDHTQVMHRRCSVLWPESFESVKHSDAIFFTELARLGPFHPIDAQASVKRLHDKNLQNHIDELSQGKLENLRD